MNKKKIFSVPLNVSLNQEKFNNFKNFLTRHNDIIYDVYFSWSMPPFHDDAVGGIAQGRDSKGGIFNNLDEIMSIQNECKVRLSATFNNIYVTPDNNNLKLFIENFSPLYERGIRSITIPFSSWIYSKEITKAYPDLFIKNTVMWKVHSAREFWNLAEVGFDYINVDRTLLRNQNELQEIHKARELFHKKTGKRILISILANEYPCSGFCPFREEHSSLAPGNTFGVYMFPSAFNVCLYSHMKEKPGTGIKMNFLKMAFVPPFEEEFHELSKIVDVYKMFGRIQSNYFNHSLTEIENYKNGKGFLKNIKDSLSNHENAEGYEKTLKTWRQEIKNCNFNCWKCQLCDQLFTSLSGEKQKELVELKVY